MHKLISIIAPMYHFGRQKCGIADASGPKPSPVGPVSNRLTNFVNSCPSLVGTHIENVNTKQLLLLATAVSKILKNKHLRFRSKISSFSNPLVVSTRLFLVPDSCSKSYI